MKISKPKILYYLRKTKGLAYIGLMAMSIYGLVVRNFLLTTVCLFLYFTLYYANSWFIEKVLSLIEKRKEEVVE